MKKMLCMLLAMVMILAVFQVSFAEESAYKIAILTGTTTQGEEGVLRRQGADGEISGRRRP